MTEQLSVNQQMRMDESSKTNSVDHSMINGSDNQTMDQSGNNQALNDPVTKAVVDNIMGNLPTKKPFYRCDDCDLSFTSNAVLDAHLQGARHAKQIRSRNIMATLDESKIPFAKDAETNGLQCNVCSVRLNSLQQLHTHLNGNRHKKKAIRGGWRMGESESDIQLGLPSSSQSVITGQLLEKTTCRPCKETFDSLKAYKKHCNKKKHLDMVRFKKKEKKRRIFIDLQKKEAKANRKASKINFNAKANLQNYFVSSGFFHNGVSCKMNNDA